MSIQKLLTALLITTASVPALAAGPLIARDPANGIAASTRAAAAALGVSTNVLVGVTAAVVATTIVVMTENSSGNGSRQPAGNTSNTNN